MSEKKQTPLVDKEIDNNNLYFLTFEEGNYTTFPIIIPEDIPTGTEVMVKLILEDGHFHLDLEFPDHEDQEDWFKTMRKEQRSCNTCLWTFLNKNPVVKEEHCDKCKSLSGWTDMYDYDLLYRKKESGEPKSVAVSEGGLEEKESYIHLDCGTPSVYVDDYGIGCEKCKLGFALTEEQFELAGYEGPDKHKMDHSANIPDNSYKKKKKEEKEKEEDSGIETFGVTMEEALAGAEKYANALKRKEEE